MVGWAENFEEYDADGDGKLSEEERAKAKEARESIKDDAEVKESREAMEAAREQCREARESDDDEALTAAREKMKKVHGDFRALVKSKLEAAAGASNTEETD